MSEDMSDMLKKFSGILDGKEIPDDVKNMLNSFVSSTKNESNDSDNSGNSSQDIPNIDINTILKMQQVMKAMNSEQSNPRANLLRSLKPYLKPSRQSKVDQYIQLFNMEKVFELINHDRWW